MQIVKSIEKENFDQHGSDKFYQENEVNIKKSDHISCEERNSQTESARVFSEDDGIKLLSVVAEYYKAFPEQAQPESLLHYRQHGPI